MSEILDRIHNVIEMAKEIQINKDTFEGKLLVETLEILDDISKTILFLEEKDILLDGNYSESEGIQYICPNCEHSISVSDSTIEHESKITCPHCNEQVVIETCDIVS